MKKVICLNNPPDCLLKRKAENSYNVTKSRGQCQKKSAKVAIVPVFD